MSAELQPDPPFDFTEWQSSQLTAFTQQAIFEHEAIDERMYPRKHAELGRVANHAIFEVTMRRVDYNKFQERLAAQAVAS